MSMVTYNCPHKSQACKDVVEQMGVEGVQGERGVLGGCGSERAEKDVRGDGGLVKTGKDVMEAVCTPNLGTLVLK